METPIFVYNLISFSQSHIDAWTEVRRKNDEYSAAIKGMSKKEREEYRLANPYKKSDVDLGLGKAYRGSWLDKDALLEVIKNYGSSICECYYEYLLIEKKQVGCLDDVCWDDDMGETWFKLNYDDAENSYDYQVIEKPDCFKQTCNFT